MTLRTRSVLSLLTLCAAGAVHTSAFAVAFTSGNLAIYRVGDNSSPATSSAPSKVFIDEYSPTGTLVQSFAMPSVRSGSNPIAMIAQGNATLEGLINRSADGQYLTFTGYDFNLGDTVPASPGNGTLAQTTAAQAPRAIGRMDYNGNLVLTTSYNDSGQGSPRSVVSTNGTDFLISQGSIASGSDGGIRSTTLGSTGASTSITQDSVDTRSIKIFGGEVYASSNTTAGIMKLDVQAGTLTALPGIPPGTGADTVNNTVQFFMADLSPVIAGLDTVYLTDDRGQAVGGGLQKYSLQGDGNWLKTGGVFGTKTPAVSNLRGLTGVVTETGVTLYGVRTNNQLLKFTDTTGYNGTMTGDATLLASAPANTQFKGIDFVPVFAPPANEGDFNGDDVVDAADYVWWRKNNSGDAAAYQTWVQNFGNNYAPGSGGGSGSVPEPGFVGLLSIVALSVFASQRGTRRRALGHAGN